MAALLADFTFRLEENYVKRGIDGTFDTILDFLAIGGLGAFTAETGAFCRVWCVGVCISPFLAFVTRCGRLIGLSGSHPTLLLTLPPPLPGNRGQPRTTLRLTM